MRLTPLTENFKQALGFLTEVLIASVPLAIEIVTTTTLAIGSTEMAKFGAIVKRLAAIEDLAGLNMLCSDKTGTLTKNKMVIQNDAPTYMPGLTQLDLLKQAYAIFVAASMSECANTRQSPRGEVGFASEGCAGHACAALPSMAPRD